MENAQKKGSRVGILDELRGFAIICMVVYHAMYDLKYIFGLDVPVFFDGWFDVIRDIFAGLFIFISGTVCRYSSNNIKRGAQCFFIGSPYAIILIIFELTIALIQSIKYNIGMNIKSNIFGKIKMWVAGLIISLWYLLTDYKVIHHFNLNNLNNKTFLIIFLPLFIIEVITIISYIIEYFSDKNKLDKKVIAKRKKEEEKLYKEIKNVSFWDLMFEHDYYEKYKDYGNLKLLKSLTKKKA